MVLNSYRYYFETVFSVAYSQYSIYFNIFTEIQETGQSL